MKRAMAGPKGITKAQALREFNALFPRATFLKMYSNGKERIDEVERNETWNNFTDRLRKEGRITMEQYEGWTNPWRKR